LTSTAGLALVGPQFPMPAGIANSDILKSYPALLRLGKNDFDAIEGSPANDLAVKSGFSCGGTSVKITASGTRRQVQLVESYRDDAGRANKRTVATLGRLD